MGIIRAPSIYYGVLRAVPGLWLHSYAASDPPPHSPRRQTCAAGGEVFVKSASRFCRQPLEIQQIGFRRLTDEAGQQGVDLPAVVGLVIEPVRQRRRQLLLEFVRGGDAAVFDGAFDAPVVQPLHETQDPPVLGLARGAQLVERLEQDRARTPLRP